VQRGIHFAGRHWGYACRASEFRRDIDFERETITIRGRKGHASRTIKLKPNVVAMLRTWIAEMGSTEYPFPVAGKMTKAWMNTGRDKARNWLTQNCFRLDSTN